MAERQIGVRLDSRTLYLMEIARRATGKTDETITDYVKWALETSFKFIKIEDDQQDAEGKIIPGKSLAELANTLCQGTESLKFIALIHIAPWLMSEGETKLYRIVQHSDYFAPRRIPHEGRIQQHWTLLQAIRDGEADSDILPEDQRPQGPLAFGMLGDSERVTLYKSDPAEFRVQTEAYKKAMKGW